MRSTTTGHFEILTKRQQVLLSDLELLKQDGFYLAGGTGLALQLGHRSSVDFDYYSAAPLDGTRILVRFREAVRDVKVVQMEQDTLILRCEGVIVSLFAYPYPLLRPLIDMGAVLVASLEDIAAMKLVAIIQRGTRRDFIDIYHLIRNLGLETILSLSARKYSEFDSYAALQALAYFDDAEKETAARRRLQMATRADWKAMKKYIIAQIKRRRMTLTPK